jgi:c-di-GMP-binding flagellar brake protein YcgR
VLENGIAIPYSKAILTRREKLGLPVIKTAPVEEIKKILNETNFDKHIPTEVE